MAVAFLRASADGLHFGPHKAQRELVRQEFVIGQPRPPATFWRQILGLLRVVQFDQAFAETFPLADAQAALLQPLGEFRQAGERAVGGFCEDALVQALGQAIDRLDRRQGGEPGLVEDAVRMHHLLMEIEDSRPVPKPSAWPRWAGLFRSRPGWRGRTPG